MKDLRGFFRAETQRGQTAAGVAQVSNLLYRRFPIGRTPDTADAHEKAAGSQARSLAVQHVGNLRYWASSICALMLAFSGGTSAHAAASSTNVVLLEVENHVEIQRSGSQRWDPAPTNNLPLDPGDQVRTDQRSRALLQMYDLSKVRLYENTRVTIKPPPNPREKPTLTLLHGLLYFFSRDRPTEINIRTPNATAAIRGTEFALSHDETGRTILTLLDGEVALSDNLRQSVSLTNREQGIVELGKAPLKTAVIDTVSVIQWCLYYPAVLNADEINLAAEEQQLLAESLAAYRSGDLLRALERYPTGRQPASPAEKVYLSALLLAVGQVENASALLDSLAPAGHPDGHSMRLAAAVRKLISAVKLEKREAQLSTLNSQLSTELLAESYALQSQAQLPEALSAARKATEIAPGFAFAWARVAELEFSFGRITAASAALEKSLALAPRNAESLALKGFFLAAQYRTSEALNQFNDAISVDGALGNAWLGRGLCLIRTGQREAGRADLQTAAALEPNRSFLRSYLGKAWSDTGHDALALKELRRAKQLDPRDPTPWLYSAFLDRDLNRINPAVDELENSVALNQNRQLYRSRFLLDEDQAVRSASLAAIYREAAMPEVSLREAAGAVTYDYANYSAHLFLSESYNALRDPTRFNLRYETVWFNELLLANLLSPVGAGAFSQNLSQQEYTRLFERDRLGLSTFTEYRSDGQWRELATQFGQYGRLGYALDVDYQHNDGVRVNNGLDRADWYSTLKFQLSPEDTLLLFTKLQDYHSGDNYQYLYVTNARPDFHYDNYQTPLLALGWHHAWSPESHTLAMAGRLENDAQVTDKQAFHWLLEGTTTNSVLFISPIQADEIYRSKFEIWFGELSQIWHSGRHTLIAGGRAQTGTFDTYGQLSAFNPAVNYPAPLVEADVQEGFDRYSIYGYDQIALLPGLALTAGVAYDSVTVPANFREVPVTSGQITRSEVLPKSALVWTPLPDLTLRGMYAWSLSGASFDESFRLEPAQLAGFPQSFRAVIPESVVGSVSAELLKVWGAAADLKLASRTYLGLEGGGWQSDVRRDRGGLFNTVIGQNPSTLPFREQLDYSAYAAGVSLNQLLGERWSAGVGWRWHEASLHPSTPDLAHLVPGYNQLPGPQSATLNELWCRLQWQHPLGPFVRADSRSLWQSHQAQLTGDSNGPILAGREYVSQVNLQAGWRFKHNRGELSCGILNVGGGDYRLDPLSGYPELPHERVFFARLHLNF